MYIITKKYILHLIFNVIIISTFLNAEKNDSIVSSPYNTIPGYELEDWTKSPDFGILKFKSNVKIENLKFDRIEPSENVNEFKWHRSSIALPYGLYVIKFSPDHKFLSKIDTLIMVERQKEKQSRLILIY